ncbi:MAG: DUF1549 domain-containing protein [Planctomycetota bacterium]
MAEQLAHNRSTASSWWSRMVWNGTLASGLLLASLFAGSDAVRAADEASAVSPPISQRFQREVGDEVPDFQRHVAPLLGRLGCNGRSCHGSFQGRGGFRLSLFGYDFKFDHEALVAGEKPRVNKDNADDSLIITKPTDADEHEGGKRYEKGSWQHHVLVRWIKNGAKYDTDSIQPLKHLEITPAEIVASKKGESVKLKAVAVWADGSREDVTPLCRFQSNDEQIAKINEDGVVTTGEVGDTHVVAFYDNAVVPIAVLRPFQAPKKKSANTGSQSDGETPTRIDELVAQKLAKLNIRSSGICTDAEFLRRVSLDLTGTLPSAADVESFLHNNSPNKRSEKIDELLATPAYAAWWATHLCDYTGNNDRQLNNVNNIVRNAASQGWYDWIAKRIGENTPYDQIIEGIVLGQSRREDQSYTEYCEEMSEIYRPGSNKSFADRPSMPYYWARQNIRQPEDRAIAFAYSFMGIRIQCAQCHKHPFDTWSKSDFDRFKPFFGFVRFSATGPKDETEKLLAECDASGLKGNDLQRKLPDALKAGKTVPFGEIVATAPRVNAKNPAGKNAKPARNQAPAIDTTARLLDGTIVNLTEHKDARAPLMQWLKSADNPYFARALVNRVWSSYFHVGIVDPPDDMSLANPPSNAALLDYLSRQFIEHKFDLKWLHKEILSSATYQRSWQTNETNERDEKNFSHAVPRRLPAEVAVDAFTQAVASDEKAKVVYSDVTNRTIGQSSAGSPNRNLSDRQVALQVFGRSTRESNCDCDRSNEASLLQTVYLQNDPAVVAALNGGKDSWIDQLSRELKIRTANDVANEKAARQREEARKVEARKELVKLRVRLELAEKDNQADQVQRLKDRIAEVEKVAGVEPAAKDADQAAEKSEPAIAPEFIIRQAYLRTLSRYPTDDELQRCQQYMATAANPVEGAKGLLWTLVNTKEFIVNH